MAMTLRMHTTAVVGVSFLYVCYFKSPTAEAAILRVGNPLRWDASVPHLDYIRNAGVRQFIMQYHRQRGKTSPTFQWGDELEYGILKKDKEIGHYDLSLRAEAVNEDLNSLEKKEWKHIDTGFDWQPEYGSWMVEIVPARPFGGYLTDLLNLEENHRLRRQRLHFALSDDEIAPSLSNFPMLGVSGYKHSSNVRGPIASSRLVDDQIINPHPRMGALTANIRFRRERNVEVQMPIAEEHGGGVVDMDAMAFGMGCTCLQVTMQCRDEWESRYQHDQWAILSPLFLALSASTPFFHGKVVDTDSRWDAISQAVDCRTVQEKDGPVDAMDAEMHRREGLYGKGVTKLNKSRYSSVSMFIGKDADSVGDEGDCLSALNDLDANMNCKAYEDLIEAGVDDALAAHIAHLFVRDPLVIFDDAIENVDDETETDHFDNIQSTNWRSVRWKLPAKEYTGDNHAPGWRLEMRTLEMQLTDFENAAYILCVILLSRAIQAKHLNFYMPVSYVDENFRKAVIARACVEQKFYMRREALTSESMKIPDIRGDITIDEMTLDEIFNGSQDRGFKGILPVIREYLRDLACDDVTMAKIEPYLTLLARRARGELPTTAQFLRQKLEEHPEYKGDGNLSCAIADDLISLSEDIGMGRVGCEELVGTDVVIPDVAPCDTSAVYLTTNPITGGLHDSSKRGVELCSGSVAADAPMPPSEVSAPHATTGYVPISQCSKSTGEFLRSDI